MFCKVERLLINLLPLQPYDILHNIRYCLYHYCPSVDINYLMIVKDCIISNIIILFT